MKHDSNISLFCGDAIESMKQIPDNSVHLILTDPPYGITQCAWDACIPFQPMWEQAFRVLKDKGVIVLFGTQPFTSSLIMSNPQMFRYCWVWEKTQATGHLNAKKMPMRAHEDILVFGKKGCNYFPQKTTGHVRKVSSALHKKNTKNNQTPVYGKSDSFTDYDSTERFPRSVLCYKSDKQKEAYHPTQKPVDLLVYLIQTYTMPGDTVLDFAMGSGSTGVACKHANRNFIGIEILDEYFLKAKKRLMK